MKRLLIAPVLSLLLLGLATGCGDDNGPSAPGVAAVDLSGTWSGTITYFEEASARQSLCASEGISVVLSQNHTSISSRFVTSCDGTYELSATLEGNLIRGSIARGSEAVGRIAGFVSASRIEMTTSRGRQEPEAVNRIELVR